jgi:hypothetical protein
MRLQSAPTARRGGRRRAGSGAAPGVLQRTDESTADVKDAKTTSGATVSAKVPSTPSQPASPRMSASQAPSTNVSLAAESAREKRLQELERQLDEAILWHLVRLRPSVRVRARAVHPSRNTGPPLSIGIIPIEGEKKGEE